MDGEVRERRGRLGVLGGLLIVAGGASLVAHWSGIDLGRWFDGGGWPLFVIVPGLVLLGLAFVPPAPNGVGFAMAGSIVTAAGLVLSYQQATGHWESWAYAWALVGPGAAGIGMLGYGLLTGDRRLLRSGLSLASVAGVLFVVGALFFEAIFATGRLPFDVGEAWPVALVALGILIVGASLLGWGNQRTGDTRETASR